jgi:DNA modification methylase
MSNYEIHNGDCLEVMRSLPDSSVDCVITDPPYGETAQFWDKVLDFQQVWPELKRLCKPNAAICLFTGEAYSAPLQMSNLAAFKMKWFWWKNRASNFLNAKKRPLKVIEEVLVFSYGTITYIPQITQGHTPVNFARRKANSSALYNFHKEAVNNAGSTERFPTNVLIFNSVDNNSPERYHRNQKPTDLLRYLVRSHSNPGDTVLDFTAGSFSTGEASMLEGRSFIGIEQNSEQCEIGEMRLKRASLIPWDAPGNAIAVHNVSETGQVSLFEGGA